MFINYSQSITPESRGVVGEAQGHFSELPSMPSRSFRVPNLKTFCTTDSTRPLK